MPGRDRAEDWPRHRLDAALEAVMSAPFNIVYRALEQLGRVATVDEVAVEALRE